MEKLSDVDTFTVKVHKKTDNCLISDIEIYGDGFYCAAEPDGDRVLRVSVFRDDQLPAGKIRECERLLRGVHSILRKYYNSVRCTKK